MIADDKSTTQQIYDQLARIGKAIASPRRLELVDLLAQAERTVEELASLASMSVANTSRHLQSLRAARLVAVRRAGLYAHYRLADKRVFELLRAVRDLGETRLASVRELVRVRFEHRRSLAPIDLVELRDRHRSGDLLLLDARPEKEFGAGHITGAVSIPVEELEARLHVLPVDQEIIAYSRGPHCALADEAVAVLLANGYRARRFALGFPDWRAAGHPVEGA
jgi:DNA-binding transcriptional ArsR family regulator/rhodanese-related sulfurtransferase